MPYAFTEHGVAMLSSVLNSTRAVQLNILIIRAFVRLREALATHKELLRRMGELEQAQAIHGAKLERLYDFVTKNIVEAPVRPKRRIGFAAPVQEE